MRLKRSMRGAMFPPTWRRSLAAPSLEARVKSVLSSAPSRQGVRAIDVFKIVWLGSAAAIALAFVRPAIAQVQEAPLAPVAPAAAPSGQAAPAAAPAGPSDRDSPPGTAAAG